MNRLISYCLAAITLAICCDVASASRAERQFESPLDQLAVPPLLPKNQTSPTGKAELENVRRMLDAAIESRRQERMKEKQNRELKAAIDRAKRRSAEFQQRLREAHPVKKAAPAGD